MKRRAPIAEDAQPPTIANAPQTVVWMVIHRLLRVLVVLIRGRWR